MKNDELRIIPLGGLGEIGLNCQLWESRNGIVMVDCGMMFPEDAHPGVDAVIPDLEIIRNNASRIDGIILTHGHEDHIGALPWVAPLLNNVKIFGSRFTLALVAHKLQEFGLLSKVELCPIGEKDSLTLGDFTFHFFPVSHSIPQSYALAVETPAGKVIHSGDFKLDAKPITDFCTDLSQFKDFGGENGVRLLLADSTNVLRDGRSTTEREVRDSLEEIFSQAPGRIVIALFSSHIQRIQEVFDLAADFGREVIISGKSLATNIEIASSLGCLRLSTNCHNAFDGVPELPPEKMVLIVTGAQGEPLAALSRMVLGGHRQLDITPGDTVIMSSRVIPGHARAVSHLINEMYRLGAEVYYEGSHPVHASGHAHSEELAQLIRAVRPQLFLPIHGEYQHLVMHTRLAEKNGVARENIFCLRDGQPLVVSPDSYRIEESRGLEFTLVDGKGVGDVGPQVLRERKILGEEGTVAISFVINANTGELLGEPKIATLGVIFEPLSGHFIDEVRKIVKEEALLEKDYPKLQENIKISVRRFFRRELDRDPYIIPLPFLVDEKPYPEAGFQAWSGE